MTITNIISAIGNNRSVYPLILRDCGIEVPSKVYITRKENLKESKTKANDATREKLLDEYPTSAVWLGGIPLVEKIYDKYVIKRKGFNPKTSIKLFKEEEFQGIEYNINKFKNTAVEEVKELEKFKLNRKTVEKLTAGKFAAATIIPIIVMGFVLPKLNFALTRYIKKNRKENSQSSSAQIKKPSMTVFTSGKKDVSFTGNWISSIANLKTVDKMAITDGGLTVGRVTTSRNKDEAAVNAFRMLGSMFLNFVAPIYIAKFLDNSVQKLFGLNSTEMKEKNNTQTSYRYLKNNKSWIGPWNYLLNQNEYSYIISKQMEKSNMKSKKEKLEKIKEENILLNEQLKKEKDELNKEFLSKNKRRNEMNKTNCNMIKAKKFEEYRKKRIQKQEKECLTLLSQKQLEDTKKKLRQKRQKNFHFYKINLKMFEDKILKNKKNKNIPNRNYEGLVLKGVEKKNCEKCNRPYPKNVLSHMYFTYNDKQKDEQNNL